MNLCNIACRGRDLFYGGAEILLVLLINHLEGKFNTWYHHALKLDLCNVTFP